jgi:hypothetical protein
MELLHRELTGAIIGAYYEVYNHTSRNLPEALYERAFMLELQQCGYAVTQQDEYRIVYKVMVFPVAVGDARVLHLDALKDWLLSNNLQIGIIANFNAVHLKPIVVRT